MKNKIVTIVSVLLISALAFPAFAQPGHGHGRGHGYGGHRGHGNWVGPLIGGMILGGIIVEATRPAPPIVVQPPVQYPPIVPQPPIVYGCRQVLTIQIDQYGREYRTPVTVCN